MTTAIASQEAPRLDARWAFSWFQTCHRIIHENRLVLDELDGRQGDGDHGDNLCAGFEDTEKRLYELSGLPVEFGFYDVFSTVGMSLYANCGGMSGPLYGSIFLAWAELFQPGTHENLDAPIICELFYLATKNIKVRGRVNLGENTMLDAWWAAYQGALQVCIESGQGYEAFQGAVRAVTELVEKTRPVLNAGVYSTSLILQSALATITK